MVFRIVKGRKSWRKGDRWRRTEWINGGVISSGCRHHWSCSWCRENRVAANRRRLAEWKSQLRDWKRGEI